MNKFHESNCINIMDININFSWTILSMLRASSVQIIHDMRFYLNHKLLYIKLTCCFWIGDRGRPIQLVAYGKKTSG